MLYMLYVVYLNFIIINILNYNKINNVPGRIRTFVERLTAVYTNHYTTRT